MSPELHDLLVKAATVLTEGSLIPFVVAFINQVHWSKKTKTIVMVVVAIVVGVATYLIQSGFDFSSTDWAGLLTQLVALIAAVQAAYHGLWKPGGVAPAIERKINGGPYADRSISNPATDVDPYDDSADTDQVDPSLPGDHQPEHAGAPVAGDDDLSYVSSGPDTPTAPQGNTPHR